MSALFTYSGLNFSLFAKVCLNYYITQINENVMFNFGTQFLQNYSNYSNKINHFRYNINMMTVEGYNIDHRIIIMAC